MDNLIIIGAGGHGKVIADIAMKNGTYKKIAFLDDGDKKENLGISVVGRTCDVKDYIDNSDIFVAIGSSVVRGEIIEKLLSMGASVPTLVHPSAVIGSCVNLGAGSAVMAGAVINPCVSIGKGVIVNTCSSVDHDSVVGDYSHISVGVRISGTVNIGSYVFIGSGSTVINNITVCDKTVLGAGAVVIDNITKPGTYVGVPAKKLKQS